jgi:hypothetical protein
MAQTHKRQNHMLHESKHVPKICINPSPLPPNFSFPLQHLLAIRLRSFVVSVLLSLIPEPLSSWRVTFGLNYFLKREKWPLCLHMSLLGCVSGTPLLPGDANGDAEVLFIALVALGRQLVKKRLGGEIDESKIKGVY